MVTDRWGKPSRNRLSSRQLADDLKGILVQPPDVLDSLLQGGGVARERGVVSELDEIEVDFAPIELDRHEMGLLCDPHRHARMLGPELDDPLERRAVDRAVIRGEALGQPVRPIFACDWSQAVKSTEAAEGPMAGRE